MSKRFLLVSFATLWVYAAPCEAQQQEQDSLTALQERVEQLEAQLEQMADLVIRLEARLQLQEQRTLRGSPTGSHNHRPVEISNFDNEVLRVVRG